MGEASQIMGLLDQMYLASDLLSRLNERFFHVDSDGIIFILMTNQSTLYFDI